MRGGQPGSEIISLGMRACPPPGECETLPENAQGLIPTGSHRAERAVCISYLLPRLNATCRQHSYSYGHSGACARLSILFTPLTWAPITDPKEAAVS